MPLLKQRKWEILIRPYLKVRVGQEDIKAFPTKATEFGTTDPFEERPDKPSDSWRPTILPLRTPIKTPDIWIPLMNGTSTFFVFPHATNYATTINLSAPYRANELKLFQVVDTDGVYTKGELIPEDAYTVNTFANSTNITGKQSSEGFNSPTAPNSKIMIDVLEPPPTLEAMVSYFVTYSYEQALKVFYQLVKEIGQNNVELKEVIPIDIVVTPKH